MYEAVGEFTLDSATVSNSYYLFIPDVTLVFMLPVSEPVPG